MLGCEKISKINKCQGSSYRGGRGGHGHPNVFKKFEILSINPKKIDKFGWLATPKFCSSRFGHPKGFALATPLRPYMYCYILE